MNTRANHQPVNPHTPAPSFSPAFSIIACALEPSQIIPKPDKVCIGKIQLFLLPTFELQTASTIGLHNSFKLYGYEASEYTPI